MPQKRSNKPALSVAIAMMFGAVGATALTLIAVPLLYFEFFRKRPCPMAEQMGESCETETEQPEEET